MGKITPLSHDTDCGLGHYDGLGEYCGPHAVSSVFLIHVLVFFVNCRQPLTKFCTLCVLKGSFVGLPTKYCHLLLSVVGYLNVSP